MRFFISIKVKDDDKMNNTPEKHKKKTCISCGNSVKFVLNFVTDHKKRHYKIT